ncbi:MAG: class I SAM-dependent rRNA methyltransferase [Chloroflexi bacterium]|nr:MAG: class I SAM-dependent rRNA methyltransferase [Chloroflexota bacterium]
MVVHADSAAVLERWLPEIREDLRDFASAYVKVHPRRASRLTGQDMQQVAPAAPLWGLGVHEVEAIEGGVRYLVRPDANARGLSVLNLFAYTCSFGVSASLGGARRVLNLDLSRAYLEWGKHNYRLNRLTLDERDFVYGDAFDWLGRFARRGERFDLVIVDPPSFSSSPFSVTRDYPRLAEAAARVVAPTGILLAATNHAGTSDERFEAWLQNGLTRAGRHGQLAQRWHEPSADFPLAPGGTHPYLKVRALVVD